MAKTWGMRRRRVLLSLRYALQRPGELLGASWLILMLLVVTVYMVLIADRATTLFRFDVWSRAATIRIAPGQPMWPAELAISDSPTGCIVNGFTPARGSTLLLTQTNDSVLNIDLTGPGIGSVTQSAGQFSCKHAEPQQALPSVTATLASVQGGVEPTLRFVGQTTYGADIDALDLMPLVLEGGTIVMETDPLIRGLGRIETSYTVTKGDRLTVSATGGNREADEAVSSGLIVLANKDGADTKGFRMVGRARARAVNLIPFGQLRAEPLAIAPTIVARAQLGAQLLFLGALSALVLRLLGSTLIAFAGRDAATRALARKDARFKRRRKLHARRAALAAAAAAVIAAAGPADATTPASLMTAGRHGSAVLFRAGSQCVAVTAQHIMQDSAAADLTLVKTTKPVRATAWQVKGDIAVLRAGSDLSLCPEVLAAPNLRSLLDQTTQVQVVIVDQDGLGRIGANITGNSPSVDTLYAVPNVAADPRVEKGISGAPLALAGVPVGIVVDIREPTKQIIAVAIGELPRLFPEVFAVTQLRLPTRDKYSLDGLPSAVRTAIQAARDVAAQGESDAQRGRDEAAEARGLLKQAIPLPAGVEGTNASSIYSYTTDDGIAMFATHVRNKVLTASSRTVTPHGLGTENVIIGPYAGNVLAGHWVEGTLRLGEIRAKVTKEKPEGIGSFAGELDETGAGLSGVDVTSTMTRLGRFSKGQIQLGAFTRANGVRVEGGWDAKGEPQGYLVIWNEDGSYAAGGRYDHGILREPAVRAE